MTKIVLVDGQALNAETVRTLVRKYGEVLATDKYGDMPTGELLCKIITDIDRFVVGICFIGVYLIADMRWRENGLVVQLRLQPKKIQGMEGIVSWCAVNTLAESAEPDGGVT